ncbi:MAG: 50S ribosomal protein L25 [Lentisphaeria bacterium]|nr:50S ribosomal protein L25 [Lentisphaeria bacterium]
MTKTKHELNVQSRSLTGSANARRLRKQGMIPAVIYSKGSEPETVAVDAGEWEILSRSELNLISLKEDGKARLVLLQEVQHDFIRNCASHIDFMEVKNDQKITTHVSIHAGHAAPAGIVAGGQLEQNMHEVEIECTPEVLPESIEVDVSALGLGAQLHVRDIVLPEGVAMVTPGELVAFVVADPNGVADAAPASGATEPEVIGEKERAAKAAAK